MNNYSISDFITLLYSRNVFTAVGCENSKDQFNSPFVVLIFLIAVTIDNALSWKEKKF